MDVLKSSPWTEVLSRKNTKLEKKLEEYLETKSDIYTLLLKLKGCIPKPDSLKTLNAQRGHC